MSFNVSFQRKPQPNHHTNTKKRKKKKEKKPGMEQGVILKVEEEGKGKRL